MVRCTQVPCFYYIVQSCIILLSQLYKKAVYNENCTYSLKKKPASNKFSPLWQKSSENLQVLKECKCSHLRLCHILL